MYSKRAGGTRLLSLTLFQLASDKVRAHRDFFGAKKLWEPQRHGVKEAKVTQVPAYSFVNVLTNDIRLLSLQGEQMYPVE